VNKLKLNQLTEHIYWLPPDGTTDRPVLGAIVGQTSTLVVDAGNSPAHANLLLNELAENGIAPPSYLALTHWHWDHVFGTAVFNVPSFASYETKQVVEEMATLDWSDAALDERVASGTEIEFCRDMMKLELPDRSTLKLIPPSIAFKDQIDIDLGGITCQLIHVGGDHASDSIIVHIPQDKVVFLSDCIYPDLYHGPRNYTTKKLFPLLDRLMALDADYYLGGHHDEPMSRADMDEYATWLRTIGRVVQEVGPDRERILAALPEAFKRPLDEDDLEGIEEFIAGL
jgi:glyoxylase-like metal-dependent hydrolase (beta-lactamase superfamily II)